MSRSFFKTSFSYFSIALLSVIFFNCNNNDDATPAFDTAKQAVIDDTLLHNYLFVEKNDTLATKTSSGLYYTITNPVPQDSLVDTGDFVFLRYKLNLLDCTFIQSNFDASRAFIIEVGLPKGTRQAIAGMDEGLTKFRKGEKGYLYLPSGLGYGNNFQNGIPANSCLKFYVEVKNVE